MNVHQVFVPPSPKVSGCKNKKTESEIACLIGGDATYRIWSTQRLNNSNVTA